MRNPYTVLGISSAADPQAIRRAYKKLAVEFHPDRNNSPEAVARFKEVSEAYAILTNERERQRYARRRRQEYAAREEHRQREAAAAWRRTSEQRSAAATAAEQAFWAYARQVHARRQQTARVRSTTAKRSHADRWNERTAPFLALILMGVYLWRAWHSQTLQPWLPEELFAAHALTSPIWITLAIGLLMIVRPRWCRIPILMDEIKEVRAYGWALLILMPLLSSAVLKLTRLGRVTPWQ